MLVRLGFTPCIPDMATIHPDETRRQCQDSTYPHLSGPKPVPHGAPFWAAEFLL